MERLDAFGGDGLFESASDGLDDFGDALDGRAIGQAGDGSAAGFDAEADEFFKKAFRSFGRGLKKLKFLRKLAPIAGRIAGGFVGGPLGAKIGGKIGGLLNEDEGFNGEGFDNEDLDGEDGELREDEAGRYGLDPLSDGLAEELAALAATSDSEAEAASLLGGVTIHILAPTPLAVKRLTPVLMRGGSALGRYLRRDRRTRPLVRAIPTIQRRAVRMLVRQARGGARVTPVLARQALAHATARTLSSPRSAAKGLANNSVKRRRLRRIHRRALFRAER